MSCPCHEKHELVLAQWLVCKSRTLEIAGSILDRFYFFCHFQYLGSSYRYSVVVDTNAV